MTLSYEDRIDLAGLLANDKLVRVDFSRLHEVIQRKLDGPVKLVEIRDETDILKENQLFITNGYTEGKGISLDSASPYSNCQLLPQVKAGIVVALLAKMSKEFQDYHDTYATHHARHHVRG